MYLHTYAPLGPKFSVVEVLRALGGPSLEGFRPLGFSEPSPTESERHSSVCPASELERGAKSSPIPRNSEPRVAAVPVTLELVFSS